jgi:hypothetical protein
MEFYISPDQREKVEKKINLMLKKFEHKPSVTFSDVQQVVKTEVIDFGEDGVQRYSTKINAIKVTIDDVSLGEWTLVATVDYRSDMLIICNKKMFKNIPEQYGLKYKKCDHCGSVHEYRIESHILYNNVTSEWMQVGSSCVNKVVNGGKYLNGFIIKLYDAIKFYGGCDDMGWSSGYWRPSKRYMMEGIHVKDAFECCLSYMEEKGDVWQKAVWDGRDKICDSTNTFLMKWFNKDEKNRKSDDALFESVKAYFLGMEREETDEYTEPTLTQQIIDAFENDFIALCELYVAWFAISIYKKHLESADYENLLKSKGIEKGMRIDICGALLAKNLVEDDYAEGSYYGRPIFYYEVSFEDKNTGLVFKKNVSNTDVIEKFKCEDGLYRFNADVKYLALRNCYVGLGGRLRKQKV